MFELAELPGWVKQGDEWRFSILLHLLDRVTEATPGS